MANNTTGSAPSAYPYCTTCGGFHLALTGGCPIILPRPTIPPTPPAGTPTVTIAPADKYIVTAMQSGMTAGNIGPSATPAVPPQPTPNGGRCSTRYCGRFDTQPFTRTYERYGKTIVARLHLCPEHQRDYPSANPAPQPTSVESNWKLCPKCGDVIRALHICSKGGGLVITGTVSPQMTDLATPLIPDPVPSLAVPPTSVEEARQQLAKWPQSMNREEFLADVDALIAAVRAEATTANIDRDEAVILAEYQRGRTQAFAEVRRVVEEALAPVITYRYGPDGPEITGRFIERADILTALDALSSEGK